MSEVTISFNKTCGRIKPMHAVNNGPLKANPVEQTRGNFDDFKAAKIPYVRNHDASHCSAYGGEHTVDVHAIFPDFNKNPYEPDSYDFALTDEYLETTASARRSNTGVKSTAPLFLRISINGRSYASI